MSMLYTSMRCLGFAEPVWVVRRATLGCRVCDEGKRELNISNKNMLAIRVLFLCYMSVTDCTFNAKQDLFGD